MVSQKAHLIATSPTTLLAQLNLKPYQVLLLLMVGLEILQTNHTCAVVETNHTCAVGQDVITLITYRDVHNHVINQHV